MLSGNKEKDSKQRNKSKTSKKEMKEWGTWYVQVYGKEYTTPSEKEFLEIEKLLEERGYIAKLVRGDKYFHHGCILPHIVFNSHEEAMMYVLSFRGRVEKHMPTGFIGGG